MRNIILTAVLFSLSLPAFSESFDLFLPKSIKNNSNQTFYSRQFPGEYGTTLSYNVDYAPIISLRSEIEKHLGIKLKFFTGWNPFGEAHVTILSPKDEYFLVLKDKLPIDAIEKMALDLNIQNAKLEILGIGSGRLKINEKIEETFFVIVDSAELRQLRFAIHKQYVKNGGDPKTFDPAWFFPHITIGYTQNDIHEENGLIKNIKHSYDSRFELKITK